jgi:L-rhamnose mutarotase
MFCHICINSNCIKNSARHKYISALKKRTTVCGVSSYTVFLKKETGLLVIEQEFKKLCQNGVCIHQCAFTV